MHRRWMFVILAATTFVGCNESDGRLGITGKVSFDGQPIADGYVTLEPQGEGSTAGGKIENGTFTIAAERGPIAGKYLVRIDARRETGKMISTDPSFPEETEPETESYIPPRYNEQSELTVEISSDNTDLEWQLSSD